jgi:hypothetical protein
MRSNLESSHNICGEILDHFSKELFLISIESATGVARFILRHKGRAIADTPSASSIYNTPSMIFHKILGTILGDNKKILLSNDTREMKAVVRPFSFPSE